MVKDEKILEIQEDIRNLRDSDFHRCPADERDEDDNIIDDSRPCTCLEFDKVIDKIGELKNA
tara:strand:- start:50 stop:235 length:186 start_codon:yes stop_codon:yes gene_type:complete